MWKVISFGTVSVMLWLGACENPFQTRTPEPPTRAPGTWMVPHSPGIVFLNMRNALAERNMVNYERCFTDSMKVGRRFRFIPEATVANVYPGLFAAWSVREERVYFTRMLDALPADSLRSLRFDSLQAEIIGDSAAFVHSYVLMARHKLQSSGVPGRVSGEGRFWLIKDEFGEWSIYRWADFASGDALTWSRLKADFLR